MAVARRFVDTLAELRSGELVDELGGALKEVVGRVLATGKPGSLTLKLKVKKVGKGSGMSLVISDDVKTQLPAPERGDSVLFANDDLSLTRHDPRQPRLVDLDQAPRVVNMDREAQS